MRILYVCIHNSGRSQMAEAYTNQLARKRGLDVVAESAGTIGGKELNPLVVQLMKEDGIDMSGHHPKLLTQEMADRADKIISMGCGVDTAACPAKFMLAEDWNLDDPKDQPVERVRRIRDEVRAHVEALLTNRRGA